MKNYIPQIFFVLLILLVISACNNKQRSKKETLLSETKVSSWPHAVTYEIFIHAFYDSDGDGIGDIPGMTSKLDYLSDLGVEAVWLMPISPSPSYHKYDVTDYYGIHQDYGSMEDFKTFVEKAHQKNIKVVMDLVVNHTASDHPWFVSAKSSPDSPFRDYYVWAKKDEILGGQNKKQASGDSDNLRQWHPVNGTDDFYYGYFWGGMPDLNFDNPKVREEVFKIGEFWLSEIGVDGFRLDAARHIYPDDQPQDNHQWWVEFRSKMQEIKEDVILIGEVWADAQTVAPYLQGLHSLFNFDMGYAITNAVNEGENLSLIKKYKEIQDFYASITPDFIDATFITNHDQNRIMSEVGSDMDKAKVAASLLLTLPGAPYIYYGEEIGMAGKKPDEHIREPFLWNLDGEDKGQTKWLEAKFSTTENVKPLASQQLDENSIYNHYKSLIRFRNHSKALTFGKIDTTSLSEKGICAFYRLHDNEELLVIHNLSDSDKAITLKGSMKAFTQVVFSNKHNVHLKGEVLSVPFASTVILKKL